MKRKLIGTMLSAVLTVGMLTACGSSAAAVTTAAAKAASSTAAASTGEAAAKATTAVATTGAAAKTSGSAGSSAAAGTSKKITVLGEYDPQISGQQIIAKEKGFFQDEGLDVDLQLLTDPSVSTSMVAANEAQFYSISNYQAINLVDKGSEVCILAPTVNAGNTQVVVAGPKLKISSPKDLEGKKMGYTDGAGVIVAVKNMCNDCGVDFSKIKLVNLQASDMLSSLESGDIDFFAAWEPWGIKAQQFGATYLFTGTKSYLSGKESDVNWLNFEVCIDVSKKFMEQDPDACAAYLKAMIKATDYINKNQDECAGIIGNAIKIDKDTCAQIMKKNVYKVAYDQTFKDSCDSLAGYMASSGLNTRTVTFDELAYPDILKKIDPGLVSYK